MSEQPQTNDVLINISSKLDKIIKLLALSAIKDSQKEKEKIGLLDSVGFTSSEIGKILNKSTENVCTVLKSLKDKPHKTTQSLNDN
jgi:hypothetical protein